MLQLHRLIKCAVAIVTNVLCALFMMFVLFLLVTYSFEMYFYCGFIFNPANGLGGLDFDPEKSEI